MKPIPFLVHGGDLDTLLKAAPTFRDGETGKFFEAVEQLPPYLQQEFLEDERARRIGKTIASHATKREGAHDIAEYLIRTGAGFTEIAECAQQFLDAYCSNPITNGPKAALGLAFIKEMRHLPGARERPLALAAIALCEAAVKTAQEHRDVSTLYSITRAFTWAPHETAIEQLHTSLQTMLHAEACAALQRSSLDCYRGIVPGTERNEESIKESGRLIGEHIDAMFGQYGERVYTDANITRAFEKERKELWACVHDDGIYSDIRDPQIRDRDRQYSTLVSASVKHALKEIDDPYADNEPTIDDLPKETISMILMRARPLLHGGRALSDEEFRDRF